MSRAMRIVPSNPKNSGSLEEDSAIQLTRRQMAAARDGRRASSYLANTNPLFATRHGNPSRPGRSQIGQIPPENNNNKENEPPRQGTPHEIAPVQNMPDAKGRPFSHGYQPRRAVSLAQAYQEVVLQDLADLESQLGIEVDNKPKKTTVDTLADLERLERDLGIQVTSEKEVSQPQLPIRTWGSKARNNMGYLKNINEHVYLTSNKSANPGAQNIMDAKHQVTVKNALLQRQGTMHKEAILNDSKPQFSEDYTSNQVRDEAERIRKFVSTSDERSRYIHDPIHYSNARSAGSAEPIKPDASQPVEDDFTTRSIQTSPALTLQSQSTSPSGSVDTGERGSRPRLTKEYITDALSSSGSDCTGQRVEQPRDQEPAARETNKTDRESVAPAVRRSAPVAEAETLPSPRLHLQVDSRDTVKETAPRGDGEAPESPQISTISPIESPPNSPSPAAKINRKHSGRQDTEKQSRSRPVPASQVDSHETLKELSRILSPNSHKTSGPSLSTKPTKSNTLTNTAKVARAADDIRELERQTLLLGSISCSSSSDEHTTTKHLGSKVTHALGGLREARRGLERIHASPKHQHDSAAPIYIVIPVPRLWQSTTHNWRGWELTWLAVFLLAWSIYWLTDTIACDYYCKMDGWGNMVSPATGGPIVYAVKDWLKYVRGQCPQYWDQKRCAPW